MIMRNDTGAEIRLGDYVLIRGQHCYVSGISPPSNKYQEGMVFLIWPGVEIAWPRKPSEIGLEFKYVSPKALRLLHSSAVYRGTPRGV